MLARYNPIDIEHALRAASPPPPFPPAADRAAWAAIRAALPESDVAELIAAAERDAETPVPPLPATLWLEFLRAGRREGYQDPLGQRREMLANLVLAECLEGEGRFLDRVLDVAWALCEESSWAYPAHQHDLTDVARPHVDLSAAETALSLAHLDLLVGDLLDPALGRRIRHEVDRRCLTPYLLRHDHWWLYTSHRRGVNNWTAVCNAGVVGAALLLEPDPARLAEIVARGARSLDDYLATFDEDGGSTEGPGYWTYGFGYYTVLAHLIEQRTEGRVTFLDEPRIRDIARFPLRVMLSPGASVNFSDSDERRGFITPHLTFLARRLDLPDLMRLARAQPPAGREQTLIWGLRRLVWRPDAEPAGRFVPATHDWFGGMMWMIARQDPADPAALVLAAKGGHNGEMHNQNDVGNVIVHVNGESVVADIGRGRYTRAYFGPERYEHLVNSSLGHSVPVPNGQAQSGGADAAAVLLDHAAADDTDTLALELAGAYPPAADLASLRRRVALHRRPAPGWVELVDAVRFGRGPGTFESVVTTLGEVAVEPEAVLLRGERGALRVRFEPAELEIRVDLVVEVDRAEGPTDVRRVVFALPRPVEEGQIRLRFDPA